VKDLITLVSEIEFKARKLATESEQLKSKNRELEATCTRQAEEIINLKHKIKQLEYSKQIIKLAKALEREKGSTEAKKLINGLLREVDRCIGMLND
jgi:predicted RNase H-like nuclease (RuvC/YqgF family)